MRQERAGFAGLALIACLVALPSQATAATQLGEDFTPNSDCSGPSTFLQTSSPDNRYAAPSAGVITSWSVRAAAVGIPLRFKVGRPAPGPPDFTIVGESDIRTPTANSLNTFPVRMPVEAGDVIGFATQNFVVAGGACLSQPVSATYGEHVRVGDRPVGDTTTYSGFSGIQLGVSAILEPDADNDGFGDETQDQCPTSGATQNDCKAPTTEITKGPKAKTKKKSATFEFTGSDARAVAGFECKLDDGKFASCTSPQTVKVKKGKHTFSVRAIDQAGNVDGTPAGEKWKVKRRKKRK